MEDNKLHIVVDLMDKFMLEQNYKLILENSDLVRENTEYQLEKMTTIQRDELNEELIEQLQNQLQFLERRVSDLELENFEMKMDYNLLVERNIKMARRINTMERLFHSSDESTSSEEDTRVVRRRLF